MEDKLTCFILEPRYWSESANNSATQDKADEQKATRAKSSEVDLLKLQAPGPHGERLSLDQVTAIYERIIEPAVTGFNFRILRSSDYTTSGAVEREHMAHAAEADLIIANISWADPVVHFCLGYRAAQHKATDGYDNKQPIIAMQDLSDESRHFYLPGPLAYPVKYSLEDNDHTEKSPLIRARRDLTEAVRRWDRVRDRNNPKAAGNGGKFAEEDDPARRKQEKNFQAERIGPLPQETGYAAERSVGIFLTKDEDVATRIMSSLLKRG